MAQPLSLILRDYFNSLQGSEPTEAMVTTISAKTLLPTSEVHLWQEHLCTVELNRKRGASRAANEDKPSQRMKPLTSGPLLKLLLMQPKQCNRNKNGVEVVAVYITEEKELWIACDINFVSSGLMVPVLELTLIPFVTRMCATNASDVHKLFLCSYAFLVQ
jgi:hypothetical protein